MKRMMNMSTFCTDLALYENRDDLRGFYRSFGLDGLEVLEAGPDPKKIVVPEDTVGVHLRYFPTWYCLWSGDTGTLLGEYGSWDEVKNQFGGTDREAILRAFEKNLEFARSMGPEYVVFHVSDALLDELVTRKHRYTDEEIVDGTAEVLNRLFVKDEGFALLLENLWWPGMRLTRPEITYRLLEKVEYPRTGIMLDTGHLMHTNTALRTQEEGAAYIREVLSQYGDRSIFRGVHFHQTLSGAYVEACKKHPPVLSGSYREKSLALMDYISAVDSHQPFLCKEAEDMIDWLAPDYLVYELMCPNREALARNLRALTKRAVKEAQR